MSSEKFLSQDEVDALLQGMTGEVEEEVAPQVEGTVRPYNLATEERIVRGRMPALELINERFAGLLRIGLYNFLRHTAEVSCGPVRVTKYSEFLRNLVVPTNLNLVHIKPLRGTAMVILAPDLVFMLVDNFFGGDGRFQTRIEGREFTQTEQRTIQRVLQLIFESQRKSWQSVYPIEYEFIRSEMNTQFANIATPNEVVVSTTFTIEVGPVSANLYLCMPYAMLEPIRDLLSDPMKSELQAFDQRWIKRMQRQIQDAEVEAYANLCTIPTTLRQVLQFKVGDVIPINMPETVELKVDEVPILECRYGKLNDQYALRVEKLIHNSGANIQGAKHDE